MAELGDFLTSSSDKPSVEVTVEMMDYQYVRECKDVALLREILSQLKSGKEGYYPDLIKFTEDRLMDVLPPKEKLKILRMRKEASPLEILEAESELQKWQAEVAAQDAQLKSSTPRITPLPPVRGRQKPIIPAKPVSKPVSQSDPVEKPKRLSGYDFQAWEKFDVEAEVAKLDDTPPPATSAPRDRVSKEQQQQQEKHARQLEEFRQRVNYDTLTPLQRERQADRERQKGNEAFKTSSYEEAFHNYTLSLALSPTAVTYANRALVHLRRNNFIAAETDCTASLELDNTYVKAWSRRGLCYFKCGKYAESIRDFEHAITLAPDNKELLSLLTKSKEKYFEVEGKEYSSLQPLQQEQKTDEVSVDILSVSQSHQLFSLNDVMEIGALPLLSAPTGFTRIAIEGSDDESEDGDGTANVESGFTRIAIAESDEESEAEAEQPATAFTRVQIAEESEEEETSETFTRVPISIDESDEETPEQAPEPSSVLKASADKHMQAQEFDAAIRIYSDIVNREESDDISAAALSNRALAWLQLKNYAEVIKDTTLLLSGKASNVHTSKAYFRRALAYENTEQFSLAQADVQQVLALDANNAVALKMRDRLLLSVQQQLEKAQESDEYRSDKLRKSALQAYGEGQYDKAIEHIKEALSLTPSLPLRHLLCSCYSGAGDSDKALETALEIVKLDGNNFKAIIRVAELYLEKGDKKKCQEYVSRAQAIDATAQQLIPLVEALATPPIDAKSSTTPCTPVAASDKSPAELSEHYKLLGNKAIAAQDFSAAIKHYSTAISHDSSNLACYNNRSLAFLKSNQFAYAEKDASVVLASGDNAKAFYRRAMARKQLRNYGAAMEDISTLLFLEPQNKEAIKEKREIEDLLMLPTPPPAPIINELKAPASSEVVPGLSVRSSVTKKRETSSPTPAAATPAAVPPTPPPKTTAKPKTTPTSAPKLRPPSVPTEPPATLYELERIWRGLKNYPDLFAAYLKTFKKSTFKRVLKDAVSPDLLADIFAAVRNVLVVQDKDASVRVMTGITNAAKFQMMVTLLPDEVLSTIREIFALLENCDALKATYGV